MPEKQPEPKSSSKPKFERLKLDGAWEELVKKALLKAPPSQKGDDLEGTAKDPPGSER